jgi:hypothetical protein
MIIIDLHCILSSNKGYKLDFVRCAWLDDHTKHRCNQTFTNLKNLTLHYTTSHMGMTLECKADADCEYSFSSREARNTHYKDVHQEYYVRYVKKSRKGPVPQESDDADDDDQVDTFITYLYAYIFYFDACTYA